MWLNPVFRISKHVLASRPYHIQAKPGDVAERVLVVGDPGRADLVANELLSSAKPVNMHRGFNTYTGYFNGVRVTVSTHGIGAPSAAIVLEELKMLGAKLVIRLGTCGGLIRDVRIGDIVVALGAAYQPGGTLGMYAPDLCYPAVADPEVVLELERGMAEEGLRIHRGLVASSDAFHAEEDKLEFWSKLGLIAVEMECATIFTVSRIRGLRPGAALMVIDNLATGEFMKDGTKRKELTLKAARGALRALTRVKL
ncbi:MAG: nucleoside phosphorylase [Thermoprotei archaeon]|nr:MAG: nucleoside phosphorylase [Thermoprotei archaeon]RLE98554.1 MAG: nucleoside phosphorylase [Thermoprotei archaeon]